MKSSPRIIRVNELLKREIGDLIEKYIEHKMGCLISVTNVDAAPDLRSAKVHISILGSDDSKQELMEILKGKRAFIQKQVSKHVTLKYTPVLEFLYDKRIENGDNVLAILNELENTEEMDHG